MAKPRYIKWLTQEGLAKLEGWARSGLTDEQIANNIGINTSTLYRWKNDHEEFCEALKRGKEVVDFEVENALLNRALGQTTMVVKQSKMVKVSDEVLRARRAKFSNEYKLDNPEATKKEILMATITGVSAYEEIPISTVTTRQPPDTTAAIFWLKNRKPKEWRDRHDVDNHLSGSISTELPNMSNLTTEELKKLASAQEDDDDGG